jgi:hypothetical protein
MSAFAQLSTAERAAFVQEAAARLDLSPVIVEKDFWVCWTLRQIFQSPTVGGHLVFEGGTSLSKVFAAIQRFSEDIDLSVAPPFLGWEESELDEAPSTTLRRKRLEKLEAACAARVKGEFLPDLEYFVQAVLGQTPGRECWLEYQIDPTSNSPVILFHYPSALPAGGGYIQPFVKMEFGSLTDQRPAGVHLVKPLLAEAIPAAFEDFTAQVVALEVERTFWEKATILHAEYHRPPGQAVCERFARHCADTAALWQRPARAKALARIDLLERVVRRKARFFASSWAHYETAKPGGLRLRPPGAREPELTRDYQRMEDMFMTKPPNFAEVLGVLGEAEREINGA